MSEERGHYLVNRETGKMELHFTREAYQALGEDQRAKVKGAFLWGRRSGCWISRAKEPNLWSAEKVARELGLEDAGRIGERISFAEQQERTRAKAERRAEKYEDRADRAATRGASLQKPLNEASRDIAFTTQPNVNTSAGRAFTRQRERMIAAFDRGMDEFRKSDYWRERAATARETASDAKLKDRGFIARRIAECESNARKLRKSMQKYEAILPRAEEGKLKRYDGSDVTADDIRAQLDRWGERLEAELDKLGYYLDALDALGGVKYNSGNIKPGYIVKVQNWGEVRVLSTAPKNFTAADSIGIPLARSYAEIEEIVKAEAEPARAQPFKVGETFTLRDGEVHTIVKATEKTVTLSDSKGKSYRVTPKYLPIPASGSYMWRLHVGQTWTADTFYRE